MSRYIDADDFWKIAKQKAYPKNINESFRKISLLGIIEILTTIPTADVKEVVRGEWVHLGNDEWCCNQCGFVIYTENSLEHPLQDCKKYFCEHCGANMKGEKDNQ